jgi:hypothetical protein
MTVVRAGPTSARSAKKTRKPRALQTTPSTATEAQAGGLTFPSWPGRVAQANGAYASALSPIAAADTARLGRSASRSEATSGPAA